jgi:hypothetical protein
MALWLRTSDRRTERPSPRPPTLDRSFTGQVMLRIPIPSAFGNVLRQ